MSGLKGYISGTIIILIIGLLSCGDKGSLPVLSTIDPSDITSISAKSGGNITSDGGNPVTARGVCWSTETNPSIDNDVTSDGTGAGSFSSTISGLSPGDTYFVRAYATNINGTAYGNEASFETPGNYVPKQIIADHTVVDKFDDIPQIYIDLVKKMWLSIPGESHSKGYRDGLLLLEKDNASFAVSVKESGTPEAFTTTNLRVSRATWGDYFNDSGWVYNYGEGDWWTNSLGIERTKAGITYCNTHDLVISAMGFGWCWDMTGSMQPTSGADPVFGCRWWGSSFNSPSGNIPWGIDDADNAVTGNSVNLNTYLKATQDYIDYCKNNGYSTRIFFTTGPVDTYFTGECGYQGHLKHERIREYVIADTTRILFDYADILCYDNNGSQTTTTWNGKTYPTIAPKNYSPTVEDYHISEQGALRLAKATWWMLARIAGWDGK